MVKQARTIPLESYEAMAPLLEGQSRLYVSSDLADQHNNALLDTLP